MKREQMKDLVKLWLWWGIYLLFTTLAVFGISQINFNY